MLRIIRHTYEYTHTHAAPVRLRARVSGSDVHAWACQPRYTERLLPLDESYVQCVGGGVMFACFVFIDAGRSSHPCDKKSRRGRASASNRRGGVFSSSNQLTHKLEGHLFNSYRMKRSSGYTSKSLDSKAQAIKRVQDGATKKQVCDEFKIPRSTLNTWLKEKEKITSALETSSFTPERKRMRTSVYDELDQCLLLWFQKMRAERACLSADIISTKADVFAAQLGLNDFKCSTGWLERFKSRHAIVVKVMSGESNSCNDSGVEYWKQSMLPDLLRDYSPADIYNADETGLFWQLLPTTTHAFKGEICKGGKASKQRITVMLCSNMDGSDKRPLYVIGKSAKPRCFHGIQRLPVEYVANNKAWMVSSLFESYVRKFDKAITAQKRKVVLIIDNCPAHPQLENLQSVKVVYLPPNTTSKIQPMDGGVIRAFKCHYRRLMLTHHICSLEAGKTFEPNLLLALRLSKQAWDCVEVQCIMNCFHHCGFKQPSSPIAAPVTDPLSDLGIIFDRLRDLLHFPVPTSVSDYISCDDNVVTWEFMNDEEIVAQVLSRENNDQEEELILTEDAVVDVEIPSVTHSSAYQAVELLQLYLAQQDIVFNLSPLSTIICDKNIPRLKQTTLTDFFTRS